MSFSFEITHNSKESSLARSGVIHTPHGDIHTPAFITVGTKATVKALTAEQVRDAVGAQVVLANTYHLYLEPGDKIVAKHGGFPKMMGWQKDGKSLPSVTDSGGFQVFSLGQALGHGVSKIATSEEISQAEAELSKRDASKAVQESVHEKLAVIDEDGVTFKSVVDGTSHRFTPERSMQIQHNLGADIFFAFDECTSPLAPLSYQQEAMDRTHRWAKRSLDEHKRLGVSNATGEMQALFGVVQGGAHEDLRRESARTLGAMDFDGYGIGGSFTKDDMATAVKWVCEELPVGKPRHLLGIGEPLDMLLAIENGVDTFDCVAPTRVGRNGTLYTYDGRINITNAKYKEDMSSVSDNATWYTYQFTKSYLSHLFRADEMLAATIASIHNLKFLTVLVDDARIALQEGRFVEFKDTFIKRYYK
jgi:queuine tRNA-ribosyltransferase